MDSISVVKRKDGSIVKFIHSSSAAGALRERGSGDYRNDSGQTFGQDERETDAKVIVNALGNDASIDTLGSTHSLEEFKRGQKSFFEAAMKKQSMILDHVNFASTPEQNRRGDIANQKKLLNGLERSGARFKCTNCK